MDQDEYARVQSVRIGMQALLVALIENPATYQVAFRAKELALIVAARTDRHMQVTDTLAATSAGVYQEVEDLFRPVTSVQRRASTKS